jgi:hypothetical protein
MEKREGTRNETATWLAVDEMISRSVLLIPPVVLSYTPYWHALHNGKSGQIRNALSVVIVINYPGRGLHVLTSEVSANDIMYMQARSSLSIHRPLRPIRP